MTPPPAFDEGTWKDSLYPALEYFPQDKYIWFKVQDYPTLFLNWHKECNWYDVDKEDPYGSGPGSDSNMCWAASASNLIYWWTYMNRDYIQKYDAKFGDNPWPDYPRPSFVFSDRTYSEVFSFFRNTCKNIGNSTHFGLNWFISGSLGVPADGEEVYNKFGGYFSKVFPKNAELATYRSDIFKDTFNEAIKDALLTGKGVGIDIVTRFSAHAMVAWGAEFDENGYITALYYVDNNDSFNFVDQGKEDDFTYQRHRVIRGKINYYIPQGSKNYRVELDGKPLQSLIFLPLGREQWEAVLGK